MPGEDLHIYQLLQWVEGEGSREVVKEFLLVVNQSLKEGVQVLINNLSCGLDASEVELQLLEVVIIFSFCVFLFFVSLYLFLKELKLLLFADLELRELRAGLELLLALSLIQVGHSFVFFRHGHGACLGE